MAAPWPRPAPNMADLTLECMPPEIRSMILQAKSSPLATAHNTSKAPLPEPILKAADTFSLRLTSRRLESTTADYFGRHYFKVRKHMFSRDSIQCLINIAASPKFRTYVEEVAFGPERINSHLGNMVNYSPLKIAHPPGHWKRDFEEAWRSLLGDQEVFDDGECVVQIKKAIEGLPHLHVVRLDSCLDHFAQLWKSIWGAKKMLRQVGFESLSEHREWHSVLEFLFDYDHVAQIWPGHHHRVLQALHGIGKKSWTIEVPIGRYDRSCMVTPVDLASSEWKQSCVDVRTLAFHGTTSPTEHPAGQFNNHYIEALVSQCQNLVKLGLRGETKANTFLEIQTGGNLQCLALEDCWLNPNILAGFLSKCPATLQDIAMKEICLDYYTEDEMVDARAYPTWITIFNIMLGIRQLKAVRFERLFLRSKSVDLDAAINKYPAEDHVTTSMAAYGDNVATRLNKAVETGAH